MLIKSAGGDDGALKQFNNIFMELRKLALHPLLSSGAESYSYSNDDHKQIAQTLLHKTEYYVFAGTVKKSVADKELEVLDDVHKLLDYQLSRLCTDFRVLRKHALTDSYWFKSCKIIALLRIINHHTEMPLDWSALSANDGG